MIKRGWRSKKLQGKAALKKRHLDEYFEQHGMFNAQCQVCGGIMERGEVDWAHKRHEGMSGGIRRTIKSNGLAVHGFRSGPANCHAWLDRKQTRLKTAQQSTASISTGGVIEWSKQQLKSLMEFHTTGSDTLRGA